MRFFVLFYIYLTNLKKFDIIIKYKRSKVCIFLSLFFPKITLSSLFPVLIGQFLFVFSAAKL